jgi:hypothetical protein
VPWAIFLRLCISSIAPNDFWWHVRTGQLILQQHAIPVVDLFTYTRAGAPWVNQAWLLQVILALLMAWGGEPLVIFVHALMITAGYTLILRACAPRYGVRISVWATVVGVCLGLQSWAVRPQSFSFLAFGLLVYLIELHRQGHRRILWWAVPLFAIWVNAHGVFVFGLAALGLYIIGTLWDAFWSEEWQNDPHVRSELLELCAQGLLAVAALALNPQGPAGIAAYVLGFFQSKATVQYNQEFAPLTIRAADGIAFAFAVLLLILARLNSTARLTTSQTLILLAFAAMTLLSRRSAPWFGMVLIPILATLLQGWWRQPWPMTPGKPLLNAAVMALLFLFTLAALPWLRPSIPKLMATRPLVDKTTPVAAEAFLCQSFPAGAHGFQAIAFASYQEATCPALPTYLDTRFELFSTAQWDEYIDMQSGRYNWATIAEQHKMQYIFADVANQPNLIKAVQSNPAWQQIYQDDRAVIFRLSPQ